MKKYLIIIIVVLIGVLILLGNRVSTLQERYEYSINNEKAYAQLNTELVNQNRVFKLSIEQLQYYNDSLNMKLLEAAHEMGIKDKKIKSLQYINSTLNRKDTIIVRDTIFRDPTFKLDTVVGNKMTQVGISLEYPNKIATEVNANSELKIVVSSHKETIAPPKKFFLWRLFQKKHVVAEVNIKEENEDITLKQQRYIQILD